MKKHELRIIVTILIFLAAIFFLPYIGGYIHYDGHYPENYFDFPNLTAVAKSPYNPYVFWALSGLFLGFILFYSMPRLFGFKKIDVPELSLETKKTKLPIWFWFGLIMWGGTLFIDWMKFSEPKWIINWGAIPLFWGFTLIIDGIVFKRTNGKSIISLRPKEILAIGLSSSFGWLLFEYLNFYVQETWYYPLGDLISDSEFTIYAVLGSSGLLPMAFEWNSLFHTFPKLKNRYKNGPKVFFPGWLRNIILVLAIATVFLAPFYSNLFFGVLWFSPMVIISIVLIKFGIWTPFNGVRKGDWSTLALFGLAYFVQGFLCEFWNYFSADHSAVDGSIQSFNPDYWAYSLPYINVYHVFEMPVLGLMGYIPFGVYCAVWWIVFSFLMDIPTHFEEFE